MLLQINFLSEKCYYFTKHTTVIEVNESLCGEGT